MIGKDTIARIMDAARIEEVVGDFVRLKKRGSNYVGLCPFHNEKTPSFSVSAVKGIYKCFGCGKSGNAVGFIMEHEHFTYREALVYLAARYQIPVEEREQTPEERREETLKESLYIVNGFAQNYFTRYLLESAEGREIGLPYFSERGLRSDIIEQFKLGYCPEEGNLFTTEALHAGYRMELLRQLGLSTQAGQDFFRGRVIFTIHGVSGKVVGFAGRTLSADKKVPKYINSPETEIYVKSKIVYGLHQARKSISDKDLCFLVEGYMDVLSMYQAGIENTVASSGTSLTQDQVRLIKRYTSNLTIIYDGDPAGVKAALRGLDIALEEGMNVKVVLLPENEDPDTFVHASGKEGFLRYVGENQKDIIHLRTALFLEEAGDDPAKVAGIIRDIVGSIARIPDPITRSLYIKQTAKKLQVEEEILFAETNKMLRKKAYDRLNTYDRASAGEALPEMQLKQEETFTFHLDESQERDIVRLLLENSNFEIEGENAIVRILSNLADVEIDHVLYQQIIEEYRDYYRQNEFLPQAHFINHHDEPVRKLVLDLLQTPYELSENWWKMHEVFITDKQFLVRKDIVKSISMLKLKKVLRMKMEAEEKIRALQEEMQDADSAGISYYQKEVIALQELIKKLSADTGTVVVPYIK